MATSSAAPVYVVRGEDGRSCGHNHSTDVTGQLCLAHALDQARRQGNHGSTFVLNRCLPDGDEEVLRVMHA